MVYGYYCPKAIAAHGLHPKFGAELVMTASTQAWLELRRI